MKMCSPYYSPFLGITKERMSQGPQVAYIECREMDSLVMSTYIDEDPLHHHTSLVHHDGIHHIILFPKDNGSCSMRYKLGIVVSVTLILKVFEYVAFKVVFGYRTYAWKL
jgi:hypothetical protein